MLAIAYCEFLQPRRPESEQREPQDEVDVLGILQPRIDPPARSSALAAKKQGAREHRFPAKPGQKVELRSLVPGFDVPEKLPLSVHHAPTAVDECLARVGAKYLHL